MPPLSTTRPPQPEASTIASPCRDWSRLLDLGLVSVMTVAVTPVALVVALAVRWRLGRPVLFKEVRAGRGGVPFVLRKFRTMTDDRSNGALLPDEERLTAFGRTLRSTSLDEL